MRISIAICCALLLTITGQSAVGQATAPSPAAATSAQRTGNLRYENISDEEVLEIQHAVSQATSGAIVNIGSATTDCLCEKPPTCSAQVIVLIAKPNKSERFRLSRMDGHWQLSAQTKWELRYDAFEARYKDALNQRRADRARLIVAYEKEREQLLAEEPQCGQSRPIRRRRSLPSPQ